jgi:hypothetical protein
MSRTDLRVSDALRTALALRRLGYWPVAIHPGQKRPIGNEWGLSQWSAAKLRDTFARYPAAGVGICFGPDRAPGVGWLIDLEGDGPRTVESLRALLGDEPATVGWSSRRSPHAMYRADGERLLRLLAAAGAREGDGPKAGVWKLDQIPDVEWRVGGYHANGTPKQLQSLVPPTAGTNGRPREWIVAPHDPVADLPENVYLTLEQIAAKQRRTLTPRANGKPAPDTCNVSAAACVQSAPACVQSAPACVQRSACVRTRLACVQQDLEPYIAEAISQTLPSGAGRRNRAVFGFARRLQGVFGQATDPQTLRPYLERWHRAALPVIRTKDFATTWQDFLVAWNRIRLPAGAVLAEIRQLAADDRFSLEGDPGTDQLARVFRAANQVHAGREFYLSYRTLGSLAGLSRMTAHSLARQLVVEGLLAIVENGSVGVLGKATVWRWLGPVPGE